MSVKGNDISYWYYQEASPGEHDNNPIFKPFHRTGGVLQFSAEKEKSNTIETGRMESDLKSMKNKHDGSLKCEISALSLEEFFKAAIQADNDTVISVTAIDISTDSSMNTINSVAEDFIAAGLVNNMLIKLEGYLTDTAANSFYRVKNVSTNTLTTYESITVSAVAGDSVTIRTNRATNSDKERSYCFQKRNNGLTPNTFNRYHGRQVNTLSMDISGKYVEIELGLSGTAFIRSTTKDSSAADDTTALSNKMTSSHHLRSLIFNDALSTQSLLSAKINLDNKATPKEVANSPDPAGIHSGALSCKVDYSTYMDNESEFDLYINDTGFNVGFHFVDDAGNAFGLFIDQVQYEELPEQDVGEDGDVMVEGKLHASKSPITGKMIHFDFIPAV